MTVRRLAYLLIAVTLGTIGIVTRDIHAQALAERVIVTPGEGTVLTRYRFVGSGFPVGRFVSVRITSGEGIERKLTGDDGVELVWVVAADGGFALEFTPSARFPGAAPGRWQALFCLTGSPTCQHLEFDVAPVGATPASG